MPLSLHAAFVPSTVQVLTASLGWLDKAATHAEANGISEADMMAAKLAPDMFAFNRQVRGFCMHAQHSIACAREGVFSPFTDAPPDTFAGLKGCVSDAIAYLEALSEEEMERLIGKDMRFVLGEIDLRFTADQFLLSFSQPNFYFHVTTAYAILRSQGVEVGKRDYLGKLRIQR